MLTNLAARAWSAIASGPGKRCISYGLVGSGAFYHLARYHNNKVRIAGYEGYSRGLKDGATMPEERPNGFKKKLWKPEGVKNWRKIM